MSEEQTMLATLESMKKTYQEYRLQIAKKAYRDIKAVIDKWKNDEIDVSFFWEGSIEVDEYIFDTHDFEAE